MKLSTLLMAIGLACSLSNCGSLDEKPMKPKPYNPGDELSSRPQGQGYRPSHYSTPFGLPMSQ